MRKLNITVIVGIVVALIGAGIVFVYGHNVDHKISSSNRPSRSSSRTSSSTPA
jgi:hypothetical protein